MGKKRGGNEACGCPIFSKIWRKTKIRDLSKGHIKKRKKTKDNKITNLEGNASERRKGGEMNFSIFLAGKKEGKNEGNP